MSLSNSKRLDKNVSPFEYNGINNYYWNRQGKKHYWGVKGKDYGFIDSSRPIIRPTKIEELKTQHLKYHLNHNYQSINQSRHYQGSPVNGNEHNPQQFEKRTQQRYSRVNPSDLIRFKTEPVAAIAQKQHITIADQRQEKKKKLALLSQNVHFQKFPILQQKPEDISKNTRFLADRNYHVRTQSQSKNYDSLDQYRQRIVKITHKDRRNSPTFCNSLAYPLPCYRYVQ